MASGGAGECVVTVGHRTGFDRIATWRDAGHPEFIVCDRHRGQYDERDDLGPYDWERI